MNPAAPRFVVLRHDCPRGLHWDLMLEADDVLRTWALSEEPFTNVTCAAELLPDHRLAYLDYEGEVSGNRGTVVRCDAGQYVVRQDDLEKTVVQLNGTRLRGTATLRRESGDQRWSFSFMPDGAAANGLSDGAVTGEPSESRATVQPAMKTSSSPS